MYRCFFVAVVLILQTMASAAPSSSSEAGAHVRRGRNDKEDPCIKNPAVDARSTYRHATKTMGLLADGDIP
ncbi:hypothetical protein PSHT_10234 [Puccinia striiformis]|nr:hypothetical protein PSHT_10234 [Puccinia striiformis]